MWVEIRLVVFFSPCLRGKIISHNTLLLRDARRLYDPLLRTSKDRLRISSSKKVSSTCTSSVVSRPLDEAETVFTVVTYWLLK
jgi:hypothetical protein